MRTLPSVLFLFALRGWTAAAQIDEKPPIIRRSPTSPVSQPSETKGGKKEPDALTAEGIIRTINAKTMEVAIDDGRIFKAAIDSKTVFLGASGKIDQGTVTPGTRVRVSVKASDQMELTATSVVVEKPTVATLSGSAAKPEDDASVRQTEDTDPDRPVLKRGMPPQASKKETDPVKDDDEEEPTVAAAVAAPRARAHKPDDSNDDSLVGALTSEKQPDLLAKAHEVNLEFIAHLPNFVCQQYTTRYERENKITGWEAKDIISARVLYENQKEQYDNIKINNRSANADMMNVKGARSVGEFGSFLGGLFARQVNAEFHYDHAESFRRVHTKVYAFTVPRQTTDWTIAIGGQSIEPGYSGRVWINTETGRAMRIERQADDVPESFPLTMAEETLDYDEVMLGGRKLLLPVESSSLTCQRDSTFCQKNVIQFRDYQEFRGAASVTFDK